MNTRTLSEKHGMKNFTIMKLINWSEKTLYYIRNCTKDDLEQVLKLSGEWANEGITIGYENVKHTKQKLEKRLGNYFYIAVSENEEVVGYTFGDVKKGKAGPVISQEEEYLEIFEVFIKPEYRHKGLGTKLIKQILRAAEKNNIKRSLVGSSNVRWKETAEFYKELGFNMWYIQMYK